jgi:hypothetical protein
MRHIKKFNETKLGDFIRKTFNKDENTAMGIYREIEDDLAINKTNDDNFLHDEYNFEIDDFKITSYSHVTLNGWDGKDYDVKVDGVKLDCSQSIGKKIFKKIESIYLKEEIERKRKEKEGQEYTRKDAKIHFGRK